MAPVSVVCGILLILLGVWGKWFTGAPASETSNTALIPVGFGAALLILGLLAFRDGWRKHAMHAAAALGLIGCIAAVVRGAPNWPTYLSGGEVKNPNATLATLLMAVICGVFVALCVRSFIVARRARRLRETA